MNLIWTNLTLAQRKALEALCLTGPSALPRELGEQLQNLGLVELAADNVWCVSALGATIQPTTLH